MSLATVNTTGLADLSDHHVHALVTQIAMTLPAVANADTRDRRCSYLQDLAHRALTPGQAPYAATLPAAAIAGYLLDTRRAANTYPEDWHWACASLRIVGIEPADLLPEALELPGHRGEGTYGSPMAAFRPNHGDYRMVAVDDMPFAHNPAKCDFRQQYEQRKETIERRDRLSRLLLRRPPDDSSGIRAGRWIWEHHQFPDAANCRKHVLSDKDFQQAAADACQIFTTAQPWQRSNIYNAWVKPRCPQEPLDPATALMWSLIADPIVWDGRSSEVGNGQHRICGARVARCIDLLVARR